MLAARSFQDFIEKSQLLAPQDRVLLAISGGKDSVLMAHLFHTLGYRFALAHVNFQLRGKDSDADEVFCRELAHRFAVPFYSTRFDTKAYAAQEQVSIQMAARDLRYTWLADLQKEHGYTLIATAHHQNDLVETMLINLVRGTGVSGLHGILPKRGSLIRPMLAFTRADIDQVVEREEIRYREDASNASATYVRNKIRLEVIPVLKALNPSLEATFEASAQRFAELEELLHERVSALSKELLVADESGSFRIPLAALKQLSPLRTLLFELFRPFGFSAAVLEQLIAAWEGTSGKVFESGTYRLLLDRETLILSPLEDTPIADTLITAAEGEWFWHTCRFRSKLTSREGYVLQQHPAIAQLDADLLQFPLRLRSWQTGDHFQPFGMRGQKKLSDYFIEQKIPVHQKKHIAVLENGNGDILWIAGKRLDERYKIGEDTKKVLIFEQVQDYAD
ncbi:MAG: tRNA lysidine(34) synthetase TilS [Bacteroidota bacterium]|jgi:tRNA(Ile)-lysidine synthase